MVHCHIARQPTRPSHRAAIREALSAIIMKLLAKNAEERYQTASGLETDLWRCLTEWRGRVAGRSSIVELSPQVTPGDGLKFHWCA